MARNKGYNNNCRLILSYILPDTQNTFCAVKLIPKIVLPIEYALPKDVYFLYYPNQEEQQTRVTEFKKFTQHKSSNTLITLEVPSMKNKLYPTMIKISEFLILVKF